MSTTAGTETMSYREALGLSMQDAMTNHPQTLLMGQGVNDATRIFGTTDGLHEKFGGRVLDMPIAEEGMTGFAVGAALNGMYPIQTHIRVDFMLLAMNQIVNMAAKYSYMYGGTMKTPMLIRAVVGRSWGQGPQHSQSLHALVSHVPGLKVIMPASADSVLESYAHAVENYNGPVISIEHRLLYDMTFYRRAPNDDPFGARYVERGDAVTIVATSYMVEEAQKAQIWLKEKSGIECDIIDLHNVSDVDHNLVFESVSRTGRLIVADTSWLPYGVCAEVSRGLVQRDPSILKAPVKQIGMADAPCPTSHALEDLYYPGMHTIVGAVYDLVHGKGHGEEVPTLEFAKSQKKQFKGPF